MGITLYNRGRQAFHTKSGVIEPGKSLSVSEEDAKLLEGYPDLVDASKLVGASTNAAELASIKTENQKLKGQVAELQKENIRLEAELNEAKDSLADAKLEAEKETPAPHASKGREAKKKGKK